MNKRLSYKKDGKWVTVASVKLNQWGNYNVGINKAAMREALKGDDWLNLSVFDQEDERKPQAVETDEDSSIPF